MLGLFLGILNAIPGLATKFLDYQVQKANVNLEAFRTATGFEIEAYKAWLGSVVETNRMKMVQNGWWGAKLIILTAGWTASVHMAAVFLDSMPFLWHEVGAWGVPRPPAPYDAYQEKIVLSFFLVAPAMPVLNSFAVWLGRK